MNWLSRRWKSVVEASKQLDAQTLASAMTLGVVVGLMPLPGLTTFPLLAVAGLMRMPAAAIAIAQFVNLCMSIPMLLLIPTFACIGQAMVMSTTDFMQCQQDTFALVAEIRKSPYDALVGSTTAILTALLAWLFALMVLVPMVHMFMFGLTSRVIKKPKIEMPRYRHSD